jgi:hypothetical protein
MDRNGTRLAAQIDESQNRPFAVFGRLPRIEEEIRIIDGKKACLIAIERPRQIERLVLRADLVLLQRCRFFPTHAAQLLLPDYCKYRLDSAGTKIANTTRPSLPIMYGSEGASNWIAADPMC